MAEAIQIKAQTRTETGSSAARRLRRDGWLPGAFNGLDGKAASLKMNRHDFETMLRHHRSEHLMVQLFVDDAEMPRMALLREVQHHIMDGSPIHVDFGEVRMSERMHVSVPVVLKGEPAGVKHQGGILEQQLFEIEIACLPSDLPEAFEVNVAELDVGDAATVAEMALDPKRFEALVADDTVVALVSAPRLEAKSEAEEAEDAEGEPEVIGKGKEETEG